MKQLLTHYDTVHNNCCNAVRFNPMQCCHERVQDGAAGRRSRERGTLIYSAINIQTHAKAGALPGVKHKHTQHKQGKKDKTKEAKLVSKKKLNKIRNMNKQLKS